MNRKTTSRDLTTGSILNHIKALAIPASIGFLFNTLFNVVDTIYVGRLSTEALAGLTFSFPIYFLMIAFTNGTSQAITALTSNDIGQKNFKMYHTYIKNGFVLVLIMAVVFAIVGFTAVPYVFSLMGATGETLDLGISYVQVIYTGSIFFGLNFFMSGILNAEGNTKPFRNYIIIGFFLNIVLNPLFIFGWFGLPRLSTAGVALATILIQMIGSMYLYTAMKHSAYFSFKTVKAVKIRFQDVWTVFTQALPVSLTSATIALGVFVINYFAVRYGGDAAVAGYGAALRIEQLLFLPTIGLNIATLSIVGQNYGAKQFDRMKEAIKKATLIGLAIMGFSMGVTFVLAPVLMPLFINDAAVIELGVSYLRIATVGFTSYIFLNISVSTLQAIKRPGFSFFVGVYRQLFPAFIFYLLGGVLGYGVSGVWWGIVLVNWSAVFLTVPYTIYLFNKATHPAL